MMKLIHVRKIQTLPGLPVNVKRESETKYNLSCGIEWQQNWTGWISSCNANPRNQSTYIRMKWKIQIIRHIRNLNIKPTKNQQKMPKQTEGILFLSQIMTYARLIYPMWSNWRLFKGLGRARVERWGLVPVFELLIDAAHTRRWPLKKLADDQFEVKTCRWPTKKNLQMAH